MRDLTPEENDRQGLAVANITRWCHLCEEYAAELSDEYSKERFEELLIKSKNLLPVLSDPFYAGAGRHAIINALCKAARLNEARLLLSEVKEQFIREKILEDNPALPEA